MFKRRFKLAGKIVIGMFLALLAFLLVERFRGQLALAKFKKELLAQGEKLSPRDFLQEFNDDDNGVPAVLAAIEKLRKGTVLPDNAPYRMQVFASGRAKINYLESCWITKLGMVDGEWSDLPVTNDWTQLAVDLAANSNALREARAALNKPVLNNRLDYSLGPKIKTPHLARSKNLNAWFGGGIQLALHEGNHAAALENLLALIRLQAMFENDHTILSELVRYAVGGIGKTDTWEALQANGWKDAALSQMQSAWQSQNYAAGMVSALERELVTHSISYQQLRASNDETYQLLTTLDVIQTALKPLLNALNPDETEEAGFWERVPLYERITEFLQRQIHCRLWRFSWSHQAELKDLKTIHAALGFARRVVASSDYASIKKEMTQWLDEWERPGVYDRFRYLPFELRGTYEKFISKTIRMETDRSLVLTAIALKRHRLRYNEYPVSLEFLIPEFCSAVPMDWTDGEPLKFRLNGDGSFTLYSSGEDGTDDGGDLSPPDGSKSKDLWRRKDYVWPAPATPDELEAYRIEAIKN